MAPLPANNTGRIFYDYVTANTAGVEHTVAWRVPLGDFSSTVAQDEFLAFLQAVGAGTFRVGWRLIRARYQAAGAAFSTPLALNAGLTAFVGTNSVSYPAQREAEEWTWQGRSNTSGRRVDFSLYGLAVNPPSNFRYPAGGASPAFVALSVNRLNTQEALGRAVAIDGSSPTWYPYVNFNANSYWERRLRTS